MIDRKARDANALALRRLASGRISNWEYEELVEPSNYDRANWYVHYHGAWPLYSDGHSPEFVKLNEKDRKTVVRCILFLHSDNKYEWSHEEHRAPAYALLHIILHFLSLGLLRDPKLNFGTKEFREQGDFEVWPFISRESYNIALTHPRYFTGLSSE